MHKLTWNGHSNFVVETKGAVVWLDPFFEGNPSAKKPWKELAKPDLILVTHDHGDHVGQTVEIAKATGAMVGAVVETAARLIERGVPQKQIVNGIGWNLGGSITYKGVTATMTEAHHTSESGAAVGYIVTFEDGCTLYHSGDTAIFPGMKLWGDLYAIDFAALPIGGVFTMDPRQAAYACELLQCQAVIPMHWGTFPVLERNTKAFREHLAERAPECVCIDLKPGESYMLEKRADTCGCGD